MRPGRANKYVTLSRSPQTSPDNDGFYEALDPAGWWVQVMPEGAWSSDGTRTMGYRVMGRYRSDVTIDTRITWDDSGTTRQLFVKGVQNTDGANKELVLYCEETTV